MSHSGACQCLGAGLTITFCLPFTFLNPSQQKQDAPTENVIHAGINLQYYSPGQVQELVLLDLSPGMLSQAQQKAVTTPTTFVQGDVQKLPFSDSSFDTVVDTFSFCVYPDPAQAAQEMVRVLTPGSAPCSCISVRYPYVACLADCLPISIAMRSRCVLCRWAVAAAGTLSKPEQGSRMVSRCYQRAC